jgi:hypothetical protein
MCVGGPADNIPVDAPNGANAPIRSDRSSKARTEADTSSRRHRRRSQSHSESDLGSAFDPTRTVAHAGTRRFNTGIAFVPNPPNRPRLRRRLSDRADPAGRVPHRACEFAHKQAPPSAERDDCSAADAARQGAVFGRLLFAERGHEGQGGRRCPKWCEAVAVSARQRLLHAAAIGQTRPPTPPPPGLELVQRRTLAAPIGRGPADRSAAAAFVWNGSRGSLVSSRARTSATVATQSEPAWLASSRERSSERRRRRDVNAAAACRGAGRLRSPMLGRPSLSPCGTRARDVSADPVAAFVRKQAPRATARDDRFSREAVVTARARLAAEFRPKRARGQRRAAFRSQRHSGTCLPRSWR